MRHIGGEFIQKYRFHHPASIIISGSSGTGKTSFAFELVRQNFFSKRIRNVHYFGCTTFNQDDMNLDEKLPDIAVNFHEGLPSEGFFNKLESRSLVIIDDLYEVRKYKIILLKFMKFFRKQLTMMPFQGLSEWTADTLVSVFV